MRAKIIITDNYQLMSEAAARLVIEQIKKKPNAVLGLATGATPIGLYENLVKAAWLKTVSLSQTKAFLLDEYVGLNKADSRSFHYFIKNKLFDRVDIKKENTFIPDGQAQDLKKECASYESLIKRHGGIDLLILGIGLNGHLAFDEPGSEIDSKTRVVKLKEQTRRANAAYFKKPSQVPRQGITIGLGTIMKARKIILLAAGENKAGVIRRALKGKITKSVPASILQTHKNLTVVLDQAAAGELMAGGKRRK